MLPLFKVKGFKAYDKDNYKVDVIYLFMLCYLFIYLCYFIAMFPVITKIFEMILLKRFEDFAMNKSYFSPLQFGLKSLLAVLRPHL